jgi:hypothetical protein
MLAVALLIIVPAADSESITSDVHAMHAAKLEKHY